MKIFNKVFQVATIGSATCAGWTFAHIYEQWKTNGNKFDLISRPALPLFGTVSAGEPQGQTMPLYSGIEPAANASRISQIMKFGFPSLHNIRSLNDYVLSYDSKNRVPYWVFEHLTSSNVAKNNNVDRSVSNFHEDASIHHYFRSQNNDYKGSGFDRGHLAAAGNHRRCQKDCDETFLLSNMSPQVGKGFNRDKWNDLERYCRKLTFAYRNVYVCTGPLFLPRLENDGKLYVKYQVIGRNHVAVPTHFFKVIVCESDSGALEMESFILPNQKIEDATPLEAFHVNPEIIERASGLLFFDQIHRKQLLKINKQKI